MEEKYYALIATEEDHNPQRPLHIVNCGHEVILRDLHYVRNRPDYYFVLLTAGEAHYSLHGEKYILKKGDAFFYKPNEQQEYSISAESCTITYWVHFMGTEADFLIEHFGLRSGKISLSAHEDIFILLRDLINEYKNNFVFHEQLALGILYRLLGTIARKNKNIDENNTLIKAIEKIHASPHTDNETLAQLCNYSKAHFIRTFKKRYGMTPLQYKQKILIGQAQQLLKNDTLNVTQISLILGFEQNPLYFNKLFKLYTGMTPLEYRKNHQK